MKKVSIAVLAATMLSVVPGASHAHNHPPSVNGPVHLGTTRQCAKITSKITHATTPIGQAGFQGSGTLNAYWWTGSSCGSASTVPEMTMQIWFVRKVGVYFIDCLPGGPPSAAAQAWFHSDTGEKILVRGDVCQDGYVLKAGDLVATRVIWGMTTNDQPPVTYTNQNLYSPTHEI